MKLFFSAKRMTAALSTAAALALTVLSPLSAFAEVIDTGETKASVVFSKGDLTLVSAPTLDFGTHKIDREVTRFKNTTASSIRVSDARGTGEGWELSVDMSGFTLSGEATLQGAKIELASPTATPTEGTPNLGAPTIRTDSQTGALTIVSGGGESIVMEADQHNGMGVWEVLFGTNETTLVTRPGTAKVGDGVTPSEATMQWILRDTP